MGTGGAGLRVCSHPPCISGTVQTHRCPCIRRSPCCPAPRVGLGRRLGMGVRPKSGGSALYRADYKRALSAPDLGETAWVSGAPHKPSHGVTARSPSGQGHRVKEADLGSERPSSLRTDKQPGRAVPAPMPLWAPGFSLASRRWATGYPESRLCRRACARSPASAPPTDRPPRTDDCFGQWRASVGPLPYHDAVTRPCPFCARSTSPSRPRLAHRRRMAVETNGKWFRFRSSYY